MQEAIYVQGESGIDTLNNKLKLGWKVIFTCSMPSSSSSAGSTHYSHMFYPTCLVIIEYKNS